jgi:hypothetical protein
MSYSSESDAGTGVRVIQDAGREVPGRADRGDTSRGPGTQVIRQGRGSAATLAPGSTAGHTPVLAPSSCRG